MGWTLLVQPTNGQTGIGESNRLGLLTSLSATTLPEHERCQSTLASWLHQHLTFGSGLS